MTAWIDPATALAGQKPLAAWWNEQVRNQFDAIGDPWSDTLPTYSPVLTASTTNPTGYTAAGRWIKAGKFFRFSFFITLGATVGTGNTYTISLPATLQNFRLVEGIGSAVDVSVPLSYPRLIIGTSGTTIAMADLTPARVTPTAPFAFAAGDILCGVGGGELL